PVMLPFQRPANGTSVPPPPPPPPPPRSAPPPPQPMTARARTPIISDLMFFIACSLAGESRLHSGKRRRLPRFYLFGQPLQETGQVLDLPLRRAGPILQGLLIEGLARVQVGLRPLAPDLNARDLQVLQGLLCPLKLSPDRRRELLLPFGADLPGLMADAEASALPLLPARSEEHTSEL